MADRKRLLLAISNGDLGGGQETARLLAQHLDNRRFQISVAWPESPLLEAQILQNPARAAEWKAKSAGVVERRFHADTMARAYEQLYLGEKTG